MGPQSRHTSIIAAAFAVLLLAIIPHAAHAQGQFQNSDMQNCRQNMLQGHMKWAQGKTIGLNQIYSNVTPPTMNASCLNKLMTLFQSMGTITDPFNIVWTLVLSLIQSFVNQICSQVMAAISSAINMIKGALCMPMPSSSLSFNAGGSGGSSSCSGVSLIGNVNTSKTGPALSPIWQWYNSMQPR